MESTIKINATVEDMNRFFDNNDVCSVRYFEQKRNGLFDARIRHAERKQYLRSTYTIPQIVKILSGKEGVADIES